MQGSAGGEKANALQTHKMSGKIRARFVAARETNRAGVSFFSLLPPALHL
jgi:hypothetical protein